MEISSVKVRTAIMVKMKKYLPAKLCEALDGSRCWNIKLKTDFVIFNVNLLVVVSRTLQV